MSEKIGKIRLAVFNPSPYARRGTVSVPWPSITSAPPPDDIAVTMKGKPLRAQIERSDPDDRQRDLLVFAVDDDLAPGDEHYQNRSAEVVVSEGDGRQEPPRQHVEPIATGVKFVNSILDAWLSTVCEGECGQFFGGAFTSIQVNKTEFLDANQAYNSWVNPQAEKAHWMDHDPEKRLQLDVVRVWRSPWGAGKVYQDEPLFRYGHRILAYGNGPVRSWVTVASPPFPYEHIDLDGRSRVLTCRFCRCISIEGDSDALLENMWLTAESEEGKGVYYLTFVARYFMYIDMGLRADVVHHPMIPDWFSVSAVDFPPQPAYAFSTDVHAANIYNPPPTFAQPGRYHRGFAWSLGPGRQVTAIHIFKLWQGRDSMADVAGKAWYSTIYKPLQARRLQARSL